MMLKNYDESVEININPDCSYLPDHPFRMLVIDGSRSSKTNMLLNLIKYLRPDVDKIYIYIYMSKIHSNESIHCLSSEEKQYGLNN